MVTTNLDKRDFRYPFIFFGIKLNRESCDVSNAIIFLMDNWIKPAVFLGTMTVTYWRPAEPAGSCNDQKSL